MRVKQWSILITSIFIGLLISGCNPDSVDKVLKGTDKNRKYEIALKFYQDKKYDNSISIFEDLLGITKGDTLQRSVAYYYAYSHFKTNRAENFPLAAYYFRDFSQTFSSDSRAEECAYMSAYCYYKSSPKYTLDQEGTHRAIEQLQYFVENYTNSERIKESNALIFKLREKLAYKKFMQAELYYRTEYYKSAKSTYEEMINSFPDSKYVEEARAGMVRSMYYYAKQSVFDKQLERYTATINLYQGYIDKHKEGKFTKSLEGLYENALNMLEKLKKAQSSADIIKQVTVAETALSKAEVRMNKMQDSIKLLRSGKIGRKNLEKARYEHDKAKERLKIAQKALKKVVSPANKTELKEAQANLKRTETKIKDAKLARKETAEKTKNKQLALNLTQNELPELEKQVRDANVALKDARAKAFIAKRNLKKVQQGDKTKE